MRIKMQRGFTLIELMIVVAIIGILAAIAIPAYQDYTIRAKMSEAITALAPPKVAIAEYRLSEGNYPDPANALTWGFETDISSKYVNSVTWIGTDQSEGQLLVSVNNANIGYTATGVNFALRPSVNVANPTAVDWDCHNDTTAYSSLGGWADPVPSKYLPAECRNVGYPSLTN